MKIAIKIKIQKESPKTIVSEYISPFEITETNKVSEIISEIKKEIKLPYEIVSESLQQRNKSLKTDDCVNFEYDLFYSLIIK